MAHNSNLYDGLTPEDVYATRRALLHRLPAELANLILEEAQYWPRISCKFEPYSELVVTESAAKCCILSPRIPGTIASPTRIAAIRFRIESHDQGWGGEAGLPGLYDGSYTWFESIIIRDFENGYNNLNDTEQIEDILDTRSHTPPATKLNNVYIWIKQFEPSPWFFGWFGGKQPVQSLTLKTVKNPNKNSDTWEIQRNRRAFREWQTHTIVWTREVEKEVDQKAIYEATGSSLGIDFVKSLQPGDRIAVLARAQYTGWQNYVKSVSLDIFFSV